MAHNGRIAIDGSDHRAKWHPSPTSQILFASHSDAKWTGTNLLKIEGWTIDVDFTEDVVSAHDLLRRFAHIRPGSQPPLNRMAQGDSPDFATGGWITATATYPPVTVNIADITWTATTTNTTIVSPRQWTELVNGRDVDS